MLAMNPFLYRSCPERVRSMRQKWPPDIDKRPHCRQTVEQTIAAHLTEICAWVNLQGEICAWSRRLVGVDEKRGSGSKKCWGEEFVARC
jgi:hypothetical protein